MKKSFFFLLKLYERTNYEETLRWKDLKTQLNTIRTKWRMERNKEGQPLDTDKRWKDETNTVQMN